MLIWILNVGYISPVVERFHAIMNAPSPSSSPASHAYSIEHMSANVCITQHDIAGYARCGNLCDEAQKKRMQQQEP